MKGNSTSIINGKIYVDGYELRAGKWKLTFMGVVEFNILDPRKGMFYLVCSVGKWSKLKHERV